MYILNIVNAMKKMTVTEIKDFVFERIGFSKKNSYYSLKQQKKHLPLFATKLRKKMPDPCNAKDHYQSFLRKKNSKSVKQPKAFENPNIKHPKTSHKLSKNEKFSQVGSKSYLYKKVQIF